ncbi:MAG: carboxypeptidase regulatory-like domain-containing protein, partial [Thermoanaerobaculia bacterium]|nr:carboxypeptidase regulatory-like domain-containing protein [Thermoanaerobaculia bacterium]
MALAASGAWAQSKTTAALSGVVTGPDGAALPGATVQISSPSLIGGARVDQTDAHGDFRFPEVAPGIYNVEVSLEGFRSVRFEGVTLAVGATTGLPVKLELAEISETLVVSAEAAVIDPSSSGTTTNLNSDYLQNLPTARFQPDVLNYAPGINQSVAYGASDSAIAYQLDGVDTSDPEGGTAWSFVNYNIVEEVQLVGLGAPAEYGSFTGVVFNSVTKSGGNQFKGLVDFLYINDSLVDEFSGAEFEGLNPRTEKFIDTTAQIGGPLAQDKLWFFLSGQYYKEDSTFGGPVRSEESPRIFGKLTLQANDSNNVEGWVEWDRYDIVGRGGDAVTPLEATVTEDAPEYVWNLSWRSMLSADTIFNLSYGGYDGYYYLDPQNGYDVAGRYDGATGLYSTNSNYYYLADRQRNQVNASISHYADDFLQGDHDFKFGMELERSTLRSRYGFPTGVWFYDNYGYAYDDPGTPEEYDGVYYTQGYYNYSYDLQGTIERGTAYVQDSWKLSPGFTLNVGVRFEINQGTVPGEGKVFDNSAIAPRVGFAWDATGDGKTVIKAHWGRFFEKFVATQFYYADPNAYTPLEFRNIYPSGYVEDLGQAAADTVVLDQDLDQPYMDQYTIGFDRELPGGVTLSFTYINRKKQDFIETVSRDGLFVPVTGVIEETGRRATLFDYLNPEDDVLAYRNVPELYREYEGYMLVANRRLRDNWQMLFSYVYSKTRGNVDNLSFSGTYGADNPGNWLNTPNSLVFADGKPTYDPTHQVKLQGTYMIPKLDLSLSGNYTFNTGDTYNIRSRCLLVDGECYDFNQGTVRVFGEPRGIRRLDDKSELDLRVEWFKDLGDADGRLGLFLADFAGSGVVPSLHTFRIKSFLQAQCAGVTNAGLVMTRLNGELCRFLPDDEIAMCLYARWDPDRS